MLLFSCSFYGWKYWLHNPVGNNEQKTKWIEIINSLHVVFFKITSERVSVWIIIFHTNKQCCCCHLMVFVIVVVVEFLFFLFCNKPATFSQHHSKEKKIPKHTYIHSMCNPPAYIGIMFCIFTCKTFMLTLVFFRFTSVLHTLRLHSCLCRHACSSSGGEVYVNHIWDCRMASTITMATAIEHTHTPAHNHNSLTKNWGQWH